MNLESLHSLTEDLLNSEIGWKKVYDKNGIVAFTKKNVFGNITSVRYRATINQSLEKIEAFAYTRMLEYMPAWSKEFMKGEVINPYPSDPNKMLLKTYFKTPFFLKNRSYLFELYRLRENGFLKVIYHSIENDNNANEPQGFIRSKLFPTVYKFTQLSENKVQVEHILSTDLGKDLPHWFQNAAPVVNGVVKANIRDCVNIKKVLESML
jgi:hypothetical protein